MSLRALSFGAGISSRGSYHRIPLTGRRNAVSLCCKNGLAPKFPSSRLTFGRSGFCTQQNLHQRLCKSICKFNETLTVVSQLFARQCHALLAQRIRRSAQIFNLYSQLGYDKHTLSQIVMRLGNTFLRHPAGKRIGAVLSAAAFSWNSESITQNQMKTVADEIESFTSDDKGKVASPMMKEWEVVIDKKDLMAWRKPVPNTDLYEYKMYGTFYDIPARAFYNAQTDVEYRRQWDKLIIKLEIVDRDEKSGCEVVQWIMHFPYPMYSREYVYIRKRQVDPESKLMVLMAHSTDHPRCPRQEDKYVRVDTYMSHMVIRPHGTSDEDGFDFVLTYHDDPKSAFPRVAYNWMASTGVPDFVEKMHQAAKTMHEWRKAGKWSSEDEEDEEEQAAEGRQGAAEQPKGERVAM